MIGKGTKKTRAVDAAQESSGREIDERQVSAPAVESDAGEEIKSQEGSFVIKRKEKAPEILREISIEELINIYPWIQNSDDIRKTKEPLLILSEQAEKGIKEHIAWNKKTKENIYEQGGILIGRPYLVNDQIIGITEYIIPANLSQASYAYLKMGTETWAEMLDIYDEKYKEDGLFIIGWFHTHPNNLPVFMSSTDMGTQRAFFDQEWHFALVINPHKKLIACFHSVGAAQCECYPTDFADRKE